MRTKDQVCSLKLAIQLKKLGVKQNSFFAWRKFGYKWSAVDPLDLGGVRNFDKDSDISAFTVAELGKIFQIKFDPFNTTEFGFNCCYFYSIYVNEDKNLRKQFEGKKEANARAKMLVYLLEKELITL